MSHTSCPRCGATTFGTDCAEGTCPRLSDRWDALLMPDERKLLGQAASTDRLLQRLAAARWSIEHMAPAYQAHMVRYLAPVHSKDLASAPQKNPEALECERDGHTSVESIFIKPGEWPAYRCGHCGATVAAHSYPIGTSM